jgi:CheY-like chemotaxis protein/anti-sigma regulatory factor (Ser/Thr protein kinase)
MLLEEPDALTSQDTARKYLKIILTAGQDSSKIVSRLRDFYRPRQNTDVFVPVDLKSVAEEVILLTQPKWRDQARARGSLIRIQPELGDVPLIQGNSAELREVLVNLVFNAVDAMPEGGVITLRTRSAEGNVFVDVADTGTGMTDEVRHRCLEPFFTTKGEQGTGLGLATVFGIIRRHDGMLDIRTKLGAGTTFEIKFPSVVATPALEERAPDERNALQILVVDDEKVTRELVVKYLERDAHRVVTAATAEEALGKVHENEFDLILTDLQMPGKSGIEFAKEMHDAHAGIPLVIFSGCEEEPEVLPEGVNAFMRKPISSEELRRVLTKVAAGPIAAAR